MGLSNLIFGLNVSCILRPVFKVYHSGVVHILFSVFCFSSIYFFKAWFLVKKVGFLVIIFSARKWRERRILHHLAQTLCRNAAFSRRVRVTSDPLSDLRTHHFGLATPLYFIFKTQSKVKPNVDSENFQRGRGERGVENLKFWKYCICTFIDTL